VPRTGSADWRPPSRAGFESEQRLGTACVALLLAQDSSKRGNRDSELAVIGLAGGQQCSARPGLSTVCTQRRPGLRPASLITS
jgi:hypothetical protein